MPVTIHPACLAHALPYGARGAPFQHAWGGLDDVLEAAAHARVGDRVDALHGKGGVEGGETVRDAHRHVARAWHAAHEKRALAAQLGVQLTDQDFHRYLNTRMAQAVCHVVTGLPADHLHPDHAPYDHQVPLEAAHAMVAEVARRHQLTSPYDRLRKDLTAGLAPRSDVAAALLAALRPLAKAAGEPLRPHHQLASEPGYVYHATNEERAHDIAAAGALATHRPHEYTDQSTWPDGTTEKRSYHSPKAHVVWAFAPEEGRPVVLRTPTAKHPFQTERGTGDVYARKPIPAQHLEIGMADGSWQPLTQWSGRSD